MLIRMYRSNRPHTRPTSAPMMGMPPSRPMLCTSSCWKRKCCKEGVSWANWSSTTIWSPRKRQKRWYLSAPLGPSLMRTESWISPPAAKCAKCVLKKAEEEHSKNKNDIVLSYAIKKIIKTMCLSKKIFI